MVQDLRDYSIFYAIKIKWTMRVQEKNEVLSMSERRKFSSIEISGYLSLDVKSILQKNFPGVAKRWVMLPMGGTYHPHPPHGYGTIVIGSD